MSRVPDSDLSWDLWSEWPTLCRPVIGCALTVIKTTLRQCVQRDCHLSYYSDRLCRFWIQCTRGRAMYSDSAIVSWRPKVVGLACRSSSWFLLLLSPLARPQSWLRSEDAGARKHSFIIQYSGYSKSTIWQKVCGHHARQGKVIKNKKGIKIIQFWHLSHTFWFNILNNFYKSNFFASCFMTGVWERLFCGQACVGFVVVIYIT